MAKKKAQIPITTEELQNFFNEFQQESDRAAALLGAALLDVQLYQLISNFLIDDKEKVDALLERSYAPLETFGARISAAYCMGLISEDERGNLVHIKDIRNRFAHELHGLSFSNDDSIKDKCKNLIIPRDFEAILSPDRPLSGRGRFTWAVILLHGQLGVRAVSALKKRCVVHPNVVFRLH